MRRAIWLKLLAEIGNMGIDNAISDYGICAPCEVEDAVAAQDAAGILNESGEQFEFKRGQLKDAVSVQHLHSVEVYPQG